MELEAVRSEGSRDGWGHRVLAALFPELCGERAGRGAELLLDAVFFGLATLLATTHFFFGMYPFALALLGAARRRVVPILLGALVGAGTLTAVGGVFAAAAVLLLLLRILFSLPVPRRVLFPVTDALFREGVPARVLAATLTGGALAAYELAVSGAAVFSLYFAAVAILSTAVFTFLLSYLPEGGSRPLALLFDGRAAPTHTLSDISLLSLLAAVTLALRELTLLGLSLGTLFAVAAVLSAARRRGAALGGVTGLLLGLLFNLVTAPALAILGLLSGLLFPFGVLYGTLGGLVGATLFVGYLGGLSGFLSLLPEGAMATLLLLPFLGKMTAARDPAAEALEGGRLLSAATAVGRSPEAGATRLFRLGTAFSALSAMFYRLSDKEKRPAPAEHFAECQRVCARFCATCSNRVRCWEQGDRIAERAVFGLAVRLSEVGRVTAEDLPDELRSGCRRMEEMLEDIRDAAASVALRRHRGDRNEFLSLDYAMIAKLLSSAAEADERETAPDEEGSRRLTEALAGEGSSLLPLVFGTRRRRVAIAGRRSAELCERADGLRVLAEGALGCRLSPPVTDTVDGVATLAMHAVSRFRVATASASVPLCGSGDRIRFFSVAEDCFYAVLSDGMGSGERAAATAEVSVEFLETMLSAGTGRATALRMLNDLVRTQSTECSATVDLFVFDRMYGHAAFFKSGAAPSYIKRGSEVFRVRSHTMPLGLVRTPDTERINVEVAVGDVVILLSDGLVPDGEEPAWLLSLLASLPTDDLDALATRLVAEAVSHIPEPRDDITVGLVRIEEE